MLREPRVLGDQGIRVSILKHVPTMHNPALEPQHFKAALRCPQSGHIPVRPLRQWPVTDETRSLPGNKSPDEEGDASGHSSPPLSSGKMLLDSLTKHGTSPTPLPGIPDKTIPERVYHCQGLT
jgi:hypothetical protein